MSGIIRLLVVSLFLTACATARNNVNADYVKSQPSSYPMKDYIIQTGDQLDIKFFYNPELNEVSMTVRPDGRISLQLINEIQAAGLTPAQLTEALGKSYAKELANPGVTVIVRTFSSQKVYVDGEVTRAGVVNLTGPMTALQAIAEAGGFKDTAKPGEVIVIRKGADSKPETIALNLENARTGEDRGQDIVLAPYDIVYVPRSTIADINLWVDQYIRRMIPIPFGLTYQFF
ncbi:MAG TPA: polysaccharide biosynthesis/export family protein [Geobacteraceae bacterium]|nr:polysaccharide biosynthesis/export family protein [Geobacteraceae bacterium]